MSLTARKSHRYLTGGGGGETLNADSLELDESEVWSSNYNDVVLPGTHPKVSSNHLRRQARKPSRKSVSAGDNLRIGPKSLPVNIPDWSKILGGAYKPRAPDEDGYYEEEDGGNDKIPPHEYLARSRVASFSVHEGIGRTLKGRDLSRVRNAIWKKTGFED
ncbi:hypothetical protein PHJA_001056900 [Phtheirospermum japonicum]|uniref:Senescence regulator n=1 Tax=Phtheirospermum japonicum TaxID=374723 RepID=A0A830BSZ6_9LAMI|nr:hypothetical protein PHJA_001056900 [Phtheirospermum japonicum]